MNKELWELVLINSEGQVLARVLELSSKKCAEDLVRSWNRYRTPTTKTEWRVSQIEGMVV